MQDSNLPRLGCKPNALPHELIPYFAGLQRVEHCPSGLESVWLPSLRPILWRISESNRSHFACKAMSPALVHDPPCCWPGRLWSYYLLVMSKLLYRLSYRSMLSARTESNCRMWVCNPPPIPLATCTLSKVWESNSVSWLEARRFDTLSYTLRGCQDWIWTNDQLRIREPLYRWVTRQYSCEGENWTHVKRLMRPSG